MKSKTPTEGMSLVVRTVTRWLKGFILLYGIYIVLYGHLTPGGGFAGGVIVACAFILITLACGQRAALAVFGKQAAEELDSLGALVFLGVALAGMALTGTFFRNFIATGEGSWFELLSAGIIPICNLGIGLKVGASLFMVFALLAAVHVAVKPGGRREIVRRGKDAS